MNAAIRRRRRWLRRALVSIGVIFVVLAATMTAALYSEAVFRYALRIAQPIIPGELSYSDIQGTLNGPVHAKDIEYEIGGTRIRATRLIFNPSPFALLAGRVTLGDVEADDLDIQLPPGDDEETDEASRSPREILDMLRLPVEVHARSLNIRNVRLLDGEAQPLVELDHLALRLAWTSDGITVERLQGQGPAFGIEGDVMLGLDRGHQSRIQLEGEWRDAAFPVKGTIRGDGNADALQLTATLSEPADISLVTRFSDLLDTPRWQGRVEFDDTRPADFLETLPGNAWNGHIEFRGAWRDTEFRVQAAGDWPPAESIDLTANGRVNTTRLDIAKLSATIGAFASQLEASARLDYSQELLYSARGQFNVFTWPGQEPFTIRDGRFEAAGDDERIDVSLQARAGQHEDARLDARGNLRFETTSFAVDLRADALHFDIDGHSVLLNEVIGDIEGRPEDYRIETRASAQYADLPPARLHAIAEGGLETLAARVETLHWLDGEASGNVSLKWRDDFAFTARVDGRNFRLDRLSPDLPVTAGGRVALEAAFDEQARFEFDVESLQGDIAGRQLEGKGRLLLAGGRISTPGFFITAGQARVQLRDATQEGFDFEVDVPDLRVLQTALRGRLNASGYFNGNLESPDVRLEAQAADLSHEEARVAALRLKVDIREGARADSWMQLEAGDVDVPGILASRLDLRLDGRQAQHRLRLRMEEPTHGRSEFALNGTWYETRWQGQIERFLVSHTALGEWVLREPVNASRIELTADGDVQFPRHCLQGPSGNACIGPFSKEGHEWHAQASLQQLPVGLLSVWLPHGLDYRGELNGEADLAGSTDGIRGQAELRLSAGSVREGTEEDALALLSWTQGAAKAVFTGRTANGELDLALAGGGGIRGQARLDVPEEAPMMIDARVQAETDDLDLLPSLIPELTRLRGRFEADLSASGPLSSPRVLGEARLRDGSARILALGTDWRNVNATLRGEGRQISMIARAESGDGHLEVELEGRETGDRFTGEAILQGDRFKALHTPEANVDISPDLRIRLDGSELFVGGDVRVPFARINPRDLSTATQPSPDQVIVNAEQRAREEGLLVNARVTTILGNDVRIAGFGLDARLDGRLTVTQLPGSPTTANGRLAVAEGQYRAYGQDLNLERGFVIYTGQQIGNPGLDIRATRNPTPDITVGVTVRGPLAQPRLSVFSEPAMPETEALSYMLFGRSLTEASSAEAREIDNTAIALGLGGQRLLGRVGERIGVEEMRVEQIGDPDQAALVLGKYLSPDLYVSYGIGLYDAVNTFRIRYRLSSKWTMEATSGLQSSADFVYTIER